MTGQTGKKVPETGRKMARRKESGSQTEDNESCGGCRKMADTITEMNLTRFWRGWKKLTRLKKSKSSRRK